MNAVLIIKEFKRGLKGFIIGSSIVAGYIALTMAIYMSMDLGTDKFAGLIESMPKVLLKAMNFNIDQWTNILGFYSTYFVFYIPLISGGFSVVWGLSQLSKEEHLKTAEFLLTRPLSRDQILTSKLVVLFTFIIGINLLAYLAGLISCSLGAKTGFNSEGLAILHFYGLMACLFYGALGVFISVLIRRGKSSTGIGVGIVTGAYLLDMILKVYGKADFLLYLTPYKYIDVQAYSQSYHLEAWRILIPLAVTVILILMSYPIYRRKDIYT